MKKKIIILIALLSGICANAQTWNIGTPNAADVKATLSNDTLYIRGTGNMYNRINGGPAEPWYYSKPLIRHVVIEEGVTNIGNYIFGAYTDLISVTIPASVTSISSTAFYVTYSVTTVRTLNPIPLNGINAWTLGGLHSTQTLYIPCGSLSAYQNTPVWRDFGTITEECPKAGVSNIKANFSCPGQVTVTYDLNCTQSTNVELLYSPDGGKTWLSARTISGDFEDQTTGAGKTIVWDSRADHVRWGKFKVKVVVDIPQPPEPECVMINGVCWATRNVDAPGAFTKNPEDAGMYYQWNSTTGWSSTDPLVSDPPGNSWDSAWNGNGATTWETTNNVCPAGYRVPTEAELQSLIGAGSQWITINGIDGRMFGSGDDTIFLPAVGCRGLSKGSLFDAGTRGYYWSSTQLNSDYAYYLNFSSSLVDRGNYYRSYGQSVRCVADK